MLGSKIHNLVGLLPNMKLWFHLIDLYWHPGSFLSPYHNTGWDISQISAMEGEKATKLEFACIWNIIYKPNLGFTIKINHSFVLHLNQADVPLEKKNQTTLKESRISWRHDKRWQCFIQTKFPAFSREKTLLIEKCCVRMVTYSEHHFQVVDHINFLGKTFTPPSHQVIFTV